MPSRRVFRYEKIVEYMQNVINAVIVWHIPLNSIWELVKDMARYEDQKAELYQNRKKKRSIAYLKVPSRLGGLEHF